MAGPRGGGVPGAAHRRRRPRWRRTRGGRGHPHRGGDALRRVRVAGRAPARVGTRGEHRHRGLPAAARRGAVRRTRHTLVRPARSPCQGRISRSPLYRARRRGGHRVGAPHPHPGARHLRLVRDAGDAAEHRAVRKRPLRRHGCRFRAALQVAGDDAHGSGAGVAGTDVLHRRPRCASRTAPDHGRAGGARPFDRLRRKRRRDDHRRRRDLVRLRGDVRHPAERRPLPGAARPAAGHRGDPRSRPLRAARRHPGARGPNRRRDRGQGRERSRERRRGQERDRGWRRKQGGDRERSRERGRARRRDRGRSREQVGDRERSRERSRKRSRTQERNRMWCREQGGDRERSRKRNWGRGRDREGARRR